MEESKIDPYQIIGFLLLIACAFWVFYFTPDPVENIDKNIIQDESEISEPVIVDRSFITNDDFKVQENEFITLENKDLKLVFSTKGAQISESVLKNYNKFDGDTIKINDNNQNFSFRSSNLNTSQLYFNFLINESSQGKEIKFFYSEQPGQSITFNYFLPNQGFLLNLDVNISGYSQSIDRNSQVELNWSLDSYQNTKSEVYENRYTYLNYQDGDEDVRDLSAYSDDDDTDSAKWISYSQHLFNSILIFDNIKKNIEFSSINLDESNKNTANFDTKEERNNIHFLKRFESKIPVTLKSNGEINEKFEWYIGPNDYYVTKEYDYNISESIWFGWGIFGWINKNIMFPLYNFLSSSFSAGLSIILMVIFLRLVMSPVQYKLYLGQAKMRILKPEITAVSEKYKDDAMKRNQETMKIYNQSGANPLSGCLPALIQLPVFYALFCFFPVAFELRGKSFLWADDLSMYDVIFELPFYIPLYGDHVSLFPITAGFAMFFYTKMSGTQQMQPTQPGMPNMKLIMYFIPFSIIIFFNNFASGLSLYYTISNILTILIMLTIKNFIIDEKKVLASIEERKKQPATENRFQRRLRKMKEMMDEAEKKQKFKKNK